MTLLPVIARELRASARHSFTYSMRVLSVLALLVVLGVFCLEGSIGPEMGGRLFGALHNALFLAIWVLVPLLTADCISRERREGTLPLLFLTNLSPRAIVYAKAVAHSLRAWTIWLAVLPLLAVPFVAGGVGWPEIIVSALVNFTSICLATSAGLLGSAMSRVWARAIALAMVLAILLMVAFLIILPLLLFACSGMTPQRFFGMWHRLGPSLGFAFAVNSQDFWQRWLGRMGRSPWPLLRGYAAAACISLAVLWVWISCAGWHVKRVWREEPLSARLQWLQTQLFTPIVMKPILGRWLAWHLRRNPIGWLEQRRWSGRLVVWSWFAVVICIYSSLFSNLTLYQRGFHEMQIVLASLLVGSIALSAAGSFRRERETGILELLLVSPMNEWQIIAGRVRGLWMQFLPSMLLLDFVWIYCATFLSNEREWLSVVIYAIAFASMPVIGLYYSLARNNIISSLLWTLLVGIALPSGIGRVAQLWYEPETLAYTVAQLAVPSSMQLLLGFLFALRLHHHLRYRQFALDRAGA